ncbi:MAG TPA: tRNA pseudouridine(54/55) synthase Pus10, partial [Candidatus Methanomethylicus sp.]|nr:tRNA pseudouridine(54/55) synthase Pus10 [Candidatus Methanomethylicus sp.]
MILDSARRMISKYTLCDCCLGRQYGGLARGVTNRERGRALKLVLAMEGHMEAKRVGADGTGTASDTADADYGGNVKGNVDEKADGELLLRALATRGGFQPAANVLDGACGGGGACYICGGELDRVREYAEGAAKALEGYGFGNFLVGVRVAGEVAEREDALKTEFAIEFGESLKMEASREIGKELSKILHKDVEFERPDIVVTVELPGPRFEVRSMPLFISGRYRKLVRGIPQSKWDCVHCGGKGCEVCHGTGKIYPISVEEIITGPVIAATG